jgi:ABC-type polysaccharide/polyol phosphate export permease
MQKGIIDRFKSLPMTRSAVLLGRTGSDIVYNALSIAIMAGTGLAVGWRIRTSIWEAIAGFALLLLFAYGFSWVMATVGLLVPSPEVVNNASFMVIMPLTFISNAFVPSDDLPTPLRVFAEWNPVSAVTQSARNLFGNTSSLTPPAEAWSMQNPELYTLIWIAVLIAVFAPISVRLYNRSASH